MTTQPTDIIQMPIPVVLYCPDCRRPHIDEGEWAHRPHRRHLCEFCKTIWRPCLYPTVGVSFASIELAAMNFPGVKADPLGENPFGERCQPEVKGKPHAP